MSVIRWVIQKNLGSSKEIIALFNACDSLGIEAFPVKIIPFSDIIPEIPQDKPSIFYGSANFVFNAKMVGRWNPCAFFSDDIFRFSYWSKKYGNSVLNSDARTCTMKELAESSIAKEDLLFIRPDRDLKEFSGQLMRFDHYLEWFNKINQSEINMTLTAETMIVAASKKQLNHEWRLFMIKKRYCSGSHYRKGGDLEVYPEVPKKVIQFAEDLADEWFPDIAYVLDIGECKGELKLIEINGFNSTGFYASNIEKIVRDISEMIVNGEQNF